MEQSVQDILETVEEKLSDLVLPISSRDIDAGLTRNMYLPMADPCHICKGFLMQSGAYMCWGACIRCYEDSLKGYEYGN